MAPVVSASIGALAPLLVKLTALLANECGRLKGVRHEIRSLRSELTSMHAALKEYTKLEDPNDQVKAWISLVRELAYDTEDVFDKFIHHLGNNRDHGGFKEFFHKIIPRIKTLGSRRGIADQIDDLKDRIKQVKELKSSYKLEDTPCSTTSHALMDPRLHALFAEETHLVGVDDPRDDLTKRIMEEGNNTTTTHGRRVLSIVGFGGLGKTTLANEVYRKIQGHFGCWAFVSISQKPDIKKIMKDVISQCQDRSPVDTYDWDERKYIAKLRELLQDKRYLIIIDDIWSTSAWDTIKCALPENNYSSRIIVTTRVADVAKSCCLGGDNRVYKMEPMSDVHSRRLFFRRIFGSEDRCSHILEEVSNEILKKCGGLPLAIISISSLLATKPAIKEEWEKVKRSVGSALEKNQNLEGVSTILSLSYNDLSPDLKTCFLYLSAFPEDYVIERERLVRRWIAEGFISERRGQSQQEVAENHFYELINKNMVQPVDIGFDGKVRACRIHDMMLEILISKSIEENFITVVGSGQLSLPKHHGFIRRLSVQHLDHEMASALANEDLSHVRSLTISSCCVKHFPNLVEFEALRLVDLEYCDGSQEYIMNGMDKLMQLKYLRLRGGAISNLPSAIVMLGDLETLDFANTSVKELPAGLSQLMKLQHLIAAGWTKIPNGIGDMRNLQVISGFCITQSPADMVKDLGRLISLDELNVKLNAGRSSEYKWQEEMLLCSLCKLGTGKLRSLQIVKYGGSLEFLDPWSPLPTSLQIFGMSGDCYFTNIPKWIAPVLSGLAYLTINLISLTEEGMRNLGELPALLRLQVHLETEAKYRITVPDIGFPSLKEFVLDCNRYGAYITFTKRAMPKLEKLEVPYHLLVAKSYGFYLGIEHLTCLKQAFIETIGEAPFERKAAAVALRKEAESHPNHPTVIILGEPDEEDNEETSNAEGKSKKGGETDA